MTALSIRAVGEKMNSLLNSTDGVDRACEMAVSGCKNANVYVEHAADKMKSCRDKMSKLCTTKLELNLPQKFEKAAAYFCCAATSYLLPIVIPPVKITQDVAAGLLLVHKLYRKCTGNQASPTVTRIHNATCNFLVGEVAPSLLLP
jgi:hypothetical protein